MTSIQTSEFTRFVRLLHDGGCLQHVILVGSWAEYLYRELSMMPGFEPNIKTMDIDFLVKNRRKPSEPISLTSLAKGAGYLVDSDRLTGVTKIYDRSGLEIEFLIGKAGAGAETSLKTNIGVTAQSLWHMDILSRNAIAVDFFGMLVNVPIPEAYAVHKMVINSERKGKREKDIAAIKGIWPFLDEARLQEVLGRLTKKEVGAVTSFVEAHLS